MRIISLGSNCEMGKMINNHLLSMIPNSSLYSHLFAWSNIKIKGINFFLKNPNLLDFNNFKCKYKFLNSTGEAKTFMSYNELKIYLKENEIIEENCSIHLDIDYTFEDIYMWTHGIEINKSDFNENNIEEYLDELKNKSKHIIKKTLYIMDDNNIKLFCIKCLKGEYSIQDIIELNTLILKYSSNNYISFIVEKDENIILDNLNLTNTCILEVPKLTGHHEAIHSDRYNTDIYYIDLFEKVKIMLNV
jgi:hypothetical protein